MGRFIKRLRTQTIRDDGKKISMRDVAAAIDVSFPVVSNAEAGTLTLETFIKLVGYYRGINHFGISMLTETPEDAYVPIDILRKFANEEELLGAEFLRAITLFPQQVFRVSYKASLELSALGYATCFENKLSGPHYYATEFNTAQDDDERKWMMPKQMLVTPIEKLDTKQQELMKWANDTLREAMSNHPEYKDLLGDRVL